MAPTDLLSPAQAGALLGVGPDRAAQLVREGILPAVRTPGGQIRIRRDAVEALANRQHEPVPDDQEPNLDQMPDTEEPDQGPDSVPPEPAPGPRPPKWHDTAPWKRRVQEAEAGLQVEEVEDRRGNYSTHGPSGSGSANAKRPSTLSRRPKPSGCGSSSPGLPS